MSSTVLFFVREINRFLETLSSFCIFEKALFLRSSRLDPRTFRASRMESRGSSFECQLTFERYCTSPLQCTWLAIFRTTLTAFPTKTSKYANYRIIVFSNLHHIRPSTHAPLNSVANQNGGILTYFDKA